HRPHVRNLAVHFARRRDEFIPQAEIQCEILGRAPVVLTIEPEQPLGMVPLGVRLARGKTREVPRATLKEVGKGVDGELAAVSRREVAEDVEVLDVGAKLQRMRATNDGEIVGELQGILPKTARGVAITAKSFVTTDRNVANDLAGDERQILLS